MSLYTGVSNISVAFNVPLPQTNYYCHCFKRDRFVCKRARVTGTTRIMVSPKRVRLADCYTAKSRYRKLGNDKLELAYCPQPRETGKRHQTRQQDTG